jgi:glycosyltransferase involved in cell wall biosynthesis
MSRILFAFGSVPKGGGTFTFYRNLRPALLEHGIDMRCVAVGKVQARLWDDVYVDNGCVLLAPGTSNVKKQAMAFVQWCETEQVDVVMGINSKAILSALPHLPERIRVLSRCANGFDHGYKITLSSRERLGAIVALTPRLERDLIQYYEADPDLIHLIPNGIDPEPFRKAATKLRGRIPKLQLGFLGRLEHNQKGVFHLPKIVRELNSIGVPFDLRIAGKGKHRRIMEREMAPEIEAGQVKFLGAIPPADVPQFLAEVDVFLFTSHIEGCPNALLEAMTAGCVPVSWLIEGITDFIIKDGETGFICSTGDYACFSRHIETLATKRDVLQAMSARVSNTARRRFNDRKAAEKYAAIIQEVMEADPPSWTPRLWREFRVDPNFERSWWKDWLRDVPLVRWANRTLRTTVTKFLVR